MPLSIFHGMERDRLNCQSISFEDANFSLSHLIYPLICDQKVTLLSLKWCCCGLRAWKRDAEVIRDKDEQKPDAPMIKSGRNWICRFFLISFMLKSFMPPEIFCPLSAAAMMVEYARDIFDQLLAGRVKAVQKTDECFLSLTFRKCRLRSPRGGRTFLNLTGTTERACSEFWASMLSLYYISSIHNILLWV